MAGAPSHTDTFDFKQFNGTRLPNFQPTLINGINWPIGILPKIATAVVEHRDRALDAGLGPGHSIAQTWVQIGRNPAGALGDIAPNIGSVVAIEKYAERRRARCLPTFLGLNSQAGVGGGYLPATYAPLQFRPPPAGIPNTTNADGAARMNGRFQLLDQLDGPLRINSPYGKALEDYAEFDTAAKALMYNPSVTSAFKYSHRR